MRTSAPLLHLEIQRQDITVHIHYMKSTTCMTATNTTTKTNNITTVTTTITDTVTTSITTIPTTTNLVEVQHAADNYYVLDKYSQ